MAPRAAAWILARKRTYRNLSTESSGATNVHTSPEVLQMLDSFEEFRQAEELRISGHHITALPLLERVLDVCKASTGISSPMSQHVSHVLLDTSCRSANLYEMPHKTLTKNLVTKLVPNTSSWQDHRAFTYLCLVCGYPELAIENSRVQSDSDDHLWQVMLQIARISAGKQHDVDQLLKLSSTAQKCLENAHDESRQIISAMILHGCGCVYFETGIGRNDARDCWKRTLNFIQGRLDFPHPPQNAFFSRWDALLKNNLAKTTDDEEFISDGVLSDALCRLSEIPSDVPSITSADNAIAGSILATLGERHHRRNLAVSAEGLYRSALDKYTDAQLTPSISLGFADCHKKYAMLLADWESRESEAQKHFQEAKLLLASQTSLKPIALSNYLDYQILQDFNCLQR